MVFYGFCGVFYGFSCVLLGFSMVFVGFSMKLGSWMANNKQGQRGGNKQFVMFVWG